MRFISGHVAVLFLLLTIPCVLFSQSTPGPSGPDQFGAIQSYGGESIDLATLNVMHDFPVFSKSGRGISLKTFVSHNSSLFAFNNNLGWDDVLQDLTGYVTYALGPKIPTVTFMDPYGVNHPFFYNGSNYVSTDGTGMSVMLNIGAASVVTTAAGAKMTVPTVPAGSSATPGGIRQDSNGNQITVTSSSVTDTLGIAYQVTNPFNNRLINSSGGSSEAASSYTPLAPTVFTYKDSAGTSRSVTISYAVFPFGYSQSQFLGTTPPYTGAPCGTSWWNPTAIQFVNLPTSITLANGQSYQFLYEQTTGTNMTFYYNGGSASYSGSYTTGRISRLTLPTGGIINYAYNAAGTDSCDGGVDYLSRTINGSQWTYYRAVTTGSSGQQVTTTVTDPSGASTSYTFASSALMSFAVYRLTSNTVLSTGSTPILFNEYCYNGVSRPCANQSSTPTSITARDLYTSYNGSSESRVSTTYGGQYVPAVPLERDEYDFGGTVPLRKTLYQYQTLNGIQTTLPSSVTIEDGHGNIYSQTKFGYDESSPTPTSGVPQHVAVSTQRGNLTSITKWSSTDSQWLSTTYRYDDTGNRVSSTDPTSTEITAYTYTDAWGADASSCAVPGDSLAYATSITDALGHVTAMTY